MIYDAIVIGAGASGLTFALEAQRRGLRVGVLEQRSQVGGLATTRVVRLRDNTVFPFDLHGGHLFNSSDPKVQDWVFEVLPKHNWRECKRTSVAVLPDRILEYPVERFGFPWETESPLGDFPLNEAGDYGAKLVAEYGPVARRYLLHYDRKMWGAYLSSLVAEYRPPTMPRNTSGAPDGASVHRTFYYPKTGGSAALFDAVVSRLANSFVKTRARVLAIDPHAGQWRVITAGGRFFAKHVVYTGSFSGFLPLVGDFHTQKVEVMPLTCVLTDDEELCRLAQGRSWLYLPARTYKGKLSCLSDFHKIDNVGLFNDRDGAVVALVATKLGIPEVPGELDREEISAAYTVQNKKRACVIPETKTDFATRNLHLLGRLAEGKHLTMDVCIRGALDLARSLT